MQESQRKESVNQSLTHELTAYAQQAQQAQQHTGDTVDASAACLAACTVLYLF